MACDGYYQDHDEETERHLEKVIDEMVAGFEAQDRLGQEFAAIDEKVKNLLGRVEAGDAGAVLLLHHLAKVSTQALNQFPATHQQVQQIAAEEYLWPMLMPEVVKAKNDPRQTYLGQLGLGKRLPLESTKFFRTETTCRLIVEHELEILFRLRGPSKWSPKAPLVKDRTLVAALGLKDVDPFHSAPRLPDIMALGELTSRKETIDLWFDAIKILVLQQTDGYPTSTSRPQLRKIGRHHETHGGAARGSSTAEGNIGRRFFELLKRTLKQVVRQRKPSVSL